MTTSVKGLSALLLSGLLFFSCGSDDTQDDCVQNDDCLNSTTTPYQLEVPLLFGDIQKDKLKS